MPKHQLHKRPVGRKMETSTDPIERRERQMPTSQEHNVYLPNNERAVFFRCEYGNNQLYKSTQESPCSINWHQMHIRINKEAFVSDSFNNYELIETLSATAYL
jgi:hypothetical protein